MTEEDRGYMIRPIWKPPESSGITLLRASQAPLDGITVRWTLRELYLHWTSDKFVAAFY